MTVGSNPATGERCDACGGYFLANDQRNEINGKVVHAWCIMRVLVSYERRNGYNCWFGRQA